MDDKPLGSLVLDANQAGAMLKLHPRTVKKFASLGIIPGKRIGRVWRFRSDCLYEWLNSDVASSHHPHPPLGEIQ